MCKRGWVGVRGETEGGLHGAWAARKTDLGVVRSGRQAYHWLSRALLPRLELPLAFLLLSWCLLDPVPGAGEGEARGRAPVG